MRYENISEARFLARPNRFLAKVLLEGREETVHIKNTGRLKELLVPQAKVYLCEGSAEGRKTAYDLVAVDSGGVCVNIDSQIPNAVACEWLLKEGLSAPLRREVFFGDSRFDICIDDIPTYIEVKGVTLVRDGVAYFPDAPTARGVKHIRGLMEAARLGHGARILFIVQRRDAVALSPNDGTHAEFGAALRAAAKSGVAVSAVRCEVTPESIVPLEEIEVRL